MKCQNCRSSEYQDAFDTCIENGHRHKIYICPICEDIYTDIITSNKPKKRFKTAKLSDTIGITCTVITIFTVVFYILIHLDKFSTIY